MRIPQRQKAHANCGASTHQLWDETSDVTSLCWSGLIPAYTKENAHGTWPYTNERYRQKAYTPKAVATLT